jgi:hypothetical protein
MLLIAAQKYGERAMGAFIGTIIGAFTVYLLTTLHFIPELHQRIDGLIGATQSVAQKSALVDSLIMADYERMMAQIKQHDAWLNGGDNGTPGIRLEVYTHDLAIVDIWGEIRRMQR